MPQINIDFLDPVDGFVKFGELMKRWADPNDSLKPPRTIGELITQGAGIIRVTGHTSADQSVAVYMLPASDVATLVVPHFDDFSLGLPADYAAPEFYGKMNDPDFDPKIDPGREEDFRLARIADYAMRKCV